MATLLLPISWSQTEAPLLIRPYLADMTLSEVHVVMTGGYATIAGSLLGAYISFGVGRSLPLPTRAGGLEPSHCPPGSSTWSPPWGPQAAPGWSSAGFCLGPEAGGAVLAGGARQVGELDHPSGFSHAYLGTSPGFLFLSIY